MPVSEQTRQVLARLQAGRVISIISTPIRRLADARALILLSQMVYWTTRDKNVVQADGWFSKPTRDWIAETRLTRSYVATCLNTLRERRVVKVWQRATKTAPWFKLDLGQLHVLCQGKPAESDILLSQFINEAAFREAIVGRPLPYYTLLADAVGDALLGLFLSRCVYWQEALEQRNRLNTRKPTWGWSSNDWTNDIGISRTQMRILLKQASDQKLIEVTETDRPFPGIWVDFEQIAKAIIMPVHKCSDLSEVGTIVDKQGLATPSAGRASTEVPSTMWMADVRTANALHEPPNTIRDDSAIAPHLDASIKTQTTLRFASMRTANALHEPPNTIKSSLPNDGFAHLQAGSEHRKHGFEQSTRARGFDYGDYTTTTVAANGPSREEAGVVVVSTHRDQNLCALIFPSALTENEQPGIRRTIARALPHRRQALLDELNERLRRKQPQNSISYLRTLVTADNNENGGLILELAHVAKARREREVELAQLRLAPATVPIQAVLPDRPGLMDSEERRKQIDRAKAALKGRVIEQTAETTA